jgi:hypothetical protein
MAPYGSPQEPSAGQNPPYGASIDYWLPAGVAAAGDSIDIAILDASGDVIRSLKGPRNAGIDRVWWNLRHDPSKETRLRTSPLHAPWVKVGEDGTRNAPGLGRIARLALPGAYTIRLTVDGREYTQPLEVRKDPNSKGTEADVRESFALVGELRADLDRAVGIIDGAERVRAQLQSLRRVHDGDDEASVDLRADATTLEDRFTAVEAKLYQLYLSGRGQDGIRWPAMLAQQIQSLAGSVEGSDYAPTTQQRAVHDELHGELDTIETEYGALVSGELAAFNRRLADEGLAGVTAGGA